MFVTSPEGTKETLDQWLNAQGRPFRVFYILVGVYSLSSAR